MRRRTRLVLVIAVLLLIAGIGAYAAFLVGSASHRLVGPRLTRGREKQCDVAVRVGCSQTAEVDECLDQTRVGIDKNVGQAEVAMAHHQMGALLGEAQRRDKLDEELDRLDRIPLLVCDEVGYIPFDPQAASLMFMLVSRRYERASMIVTSNKPFSAWGEIFGDDAVATAMLDRLVHHAEILALKGDSYRLRGKDLDSRPRTTTAENA